MAIEWRFNVLRTGGKPPRAESEKATSYLWTAEEEALVQEKRRQGLSIYEIASYVPHRGYNAVKKHLKRLPSWPVSQRRGKQFTEEELQRIVETRLKEDKTYFEIAVEMECSLEMLETLWRTRCRDLVSKEMQESIRRHRHWTPSEEQHLQELHRRGKLNISDAALQFPSKSRGSVSKKIMRERLEFPKYYSRKNRFPST